MKKYFLLLIASMFVMTTVAAEDFLLPDYEGIQSMGQYSYDILLNRFQSQDTTLSIHDLQAVYYGSAFYGHPFSRLDMRRLNAIYDAKGNDGVIIYVDSVLSVSPVNLGALRMRFITAYNADDSITTRKYLWQYDRLMDAVYATGDALTEETALHVVCVNDEYTIMNYVMQVELETQTLTTSMCDKMDIVTKKGTKMSVFFDVQLVLALEDRMISKNKKPFKFKYMK